MRCPACKERVIGFLLWSQGIHSFCKLDCPHCGANLRVSRRTVIVFVLLLLLLAPLVVGIAKVTDALGVPESTARVIFGAVMIPLVGVAAYLGWRTGSYAIRENVPHQASSDRATTTATTGLSGLRLLLLALIGMGSIAFMFFVGRPDLIIILDKQMSEGRITAIRPPVPGFIRKSDYQITYEFETNAGFVCVGEDELPSKHPPPENGRIVIAYSRRDPSVSRIASQLSDTPLSGILFGIGVILWAAVQFIRQRCQSFPSFKKCRNPSA